MNVALTPLFITRFNPLKLVALFTTTIFSLFTPLSALSNDFSLHHFSQAETQEAWRQVVSHPSRDNFFYISNAKNQLLTFNADNSQLSAKLLLDINNTQQLTAAISQKKKLTAFTLHPNFALKEQVGFATFYTAHTESVNKLSKTQRLYDGKSKKRVYKEDAVITEWQLNLTNLAQVNINSQREILRINIPKNHSGIHQLTFSPFIKPWNDNFGLLYVALNAANIAEPSSLYTGVVLRINPTKLGGRSFSVPSNNPFISNSSIHDAIFLLGAQQVKQIIWPDKNTEKLLISHHYQPQQLTDTHSSSSQWLSYARGGEDWRAKIPKQALFKNEHQDIKHIVVYQGKNVPSLRGKLTLLLNTPEQWQIASLPNLLSGVITEPLSEPIIEWEITHQAAANETVSLITNNQDEITFINHETGQFFQLLQHNVASTEQPSSSSNNAIFFILILALLGTSIWFYYKNVILKKKSVKALVHSQFAKITLDKSKQYLQLFKRHGKVCEKSIALNHLKTCQVFLGDNCIAHISRMPMQGFSNSNETDVRELFKREHTEKMIDHRVRRISVLLTDIEDEQYTVCLYLRKGNDRITKKSYFHVIDELMDWCWLIANAIASNKTGVRDERQAMTEAEIALSQHKAHDATPLHKQAAAIRPATHTEQFELEHSTSLSEQDKITPAPIEHNEKPTTVNNQPNNESSNAAVDAELVNALEKLVTLQKQGFLNPEEFNKAKAKLLKDLINER